MEYSLNILYITVAHVPLTSCLLLHAIFIKDKCGPRNEVTVMSLLKVIAQLTIAQEDVLAVVAVLNPDFLFLCSALNTGLPNTMSSFFLPFVWPSVIHTEVFTKSHSLSLF